MLVRELPKNESTTNPYFTRLQCSCVPIDAVSKFEHKLNTIEKVVHYLLKETWNKKLTLVQHLQSDETQTVRHTYHVVLLFEIRKCESRSFEASTMRGEEVASIDTSATSKIV